MCQVYIFFTLKCVRNLKSIDHFITTSKWTSKKGRSVCDSKDSNIMVIFFSGYVAWLRFQSRFKSISWGPVERFVLQFWNIIEVN